MKKYLVSLVLVVGLVGCGSGGGKGNNVSNGGVEDSVKHGENYQSGAAVKKDVVKQESLGTFLINNRVAAGHTAKHVELLDEVAQEVFDTDLYYAEGQVLDKRLDYIRTNRDAQHEMERDIKSFAVSKDSKYLGKKIISVDIFHAGDIEKLKTGNYVLDPKNHTSLILSEYAECGSTDVFDIVDENGVFLEKGVGVFCILDSNEE